MAEQMRLAKLAKDISKLNFIDFYSRDPAFVRPGKFNGNHDEYYSWLINDWIPGQRDSHALMTLFILCEFQVVPWFKIIYNPPPKPKRDRTAA